MNTLLTGKTISFECLRIIGDLSSDDHPREILNRIAVDISRKDYDLNLKIEYGARTAEIHLPPEALELSLDEFSRMYLVPACAVIAPRLPNI